MQRQLRNLILAASISLAIGATNGIAAANAKTFTDTRQETQIWTTFALNPYLRANDLNVSVADGKATLSGYVDESPHKDLANAIALGVGGIDAVDNQIIVQPDYVAPVSSAARSYGTMIDDATITAAVKSKLLWSKQADGMSANVQTESGKVTLRGTANSNADRDLAGRLARNTHGVVKVDNQLVIEPSEPTMTDSTQSTANAAGRDVADSWITTKVKSTFMYSSNVNGSGITVNTKDGIVTLNGTVENATERDLAIELAQNVKGVTSVQSTDLRY
ncbi:BON domain-containing protein [Pseudomonas defluvii]|nr:BON domain-containing protein [Pseudomonas defluvii]